MNAVDGLKVYKTKYLVFACEEEQFIDDFAGRSIFRSEIKFLNLLTLN